MANAKVSLLCACVGAAVVLPSAASAQIDPGVNYDPGSPAGKEYAIPLVEGRSDAAGTTNQRSGGNIPFGVGITPPGEKGGGKQGNRTGAAGGGEGRADRSAGARPRESSEELTARIRAAEQPPGTASRTLLLVLAVLLPAGVLALLLRPRSQVSRTGRAA